MPEFRIQIVDMKSQSVADERTVEAASRDDAAIQGFAIADELNITAPRAVHVEAL